MTKKVLTFFTLLIATAGLVSAATITQTQNFSKIPNFNQVFTFNKFDTSLGTLTAIQISLSAQASGGHVVIDNDSEDPAVGTFEFGAALTLTSAQVALLDGSMVPNAIPGTVQAYNYQSISLAANQGDGANDFSPAPPDGAEYDGGTVYDSKSGYVGANFWGGYTGTGTYNINLSGSQWFEYVGSGGIEYSVNPVTTTGCASVCYYYDPIPEPATIALLCTGGFALIRKKFHKK